MKTPRISGLGAVLAFWPVLGAVLWGAGYEMAEFRPAPAVLASGGGAGYALELGPGGPAAAGAGGAYRMSGDFVAMTVTTTTSPRLSLTLMADGWLRLSWPQAGAEGLQAEATPALGGAWGPVAGTAQSVGTEWVQLVPVPVRGEPVFFRLHRP